MLQLNPFPLKQQKDHFAGSFKFLHHPQPPCNIFGLTLHNKNCKSWKNNLLQDSDLEALMKKIKQN
jgi:hypothetical protein